MISQDFSLARLARLLATAGDVVFRHDVDYVPQCAVKMAQLEHALGVEATYYIRPDAAEYNPFSSEVTEYLDEIVGLGHALGVHVDLCLPRDAKPTDDVLKYACHASEGLLGFSGFQFERKVSFHAPPREVLWRDVPEFEHAMGPLWRDRYAADSRGVWRVSPEGLIANADGYVQLGLHPEWWFLPADEAEAMRVREAAKP